MIQYPIACDQHGSPVHIDEWERGQDVTCFGCGQDLVGRLPFDGIKPTSHFAHKGDAACAGETALHKATKAAIAHSRSLKFLSWECPHCKWYRHQTDLRSLTLREEARHCEGVVSDVLAVDASETPCLAIEVVVTHDIEAQTLERYRLAGVHVFTIRPSWRMVGDLTRGVESLDVECRGGIVDKISCEGCQQLLREKEEWAARERAQRVKAWWSAWTGAWAYIGKEVRQRSEYQRRASLVQDTREQLWWTEWARTWPRIAEQIADAWWIGWRQAWREIGIQHSRPHIWQRAWHAAWEAVGKRYAADEADRVRRLVEATYRENARRQKWWPAWIQMWTDVGQRESGATAAWHPICRRCRQDLAKDRDHQCP